MKEQSPLLPFAVDVAFHPAPPFCLWSPSPGSPNTLPGLVIQVAPDARSAQGGSAPPGRRGRCGAEMPVGSSVHARAGPAGQAGARPPRGRCRGSHQELGLAVARSGTWWDREAMAEPAPVRRAPRADAQTQARGGSAGSGSRVSVLGSSRGGRGPVGGV